MQSELQFEAYLSLDLVSPLNEIIYEIRDEFSDKKMTAMPVDLPVMGQFDDQMTLIKEFKCVKEIVDKAVNHWREKAKGQKILVTTDKYYLNEKGQLMLRFTQNENLNALVACIQNAFRGSDSQTLVHMADRMSFEPETYVILKTHRSKSDLQKLADKLTQMEVQIDRLSLYQKEAVPLTRVESWDI